jgi:UDP-glucose 6-dehydrogenase
MFKIVDAKTAEMTKFMVNSWLATKVTFCNEFCRACDKAGIYYEDVRELFTSDPRISPAHTFVYREHPYYQSHCLDKDVPSIANQFDMELLQDVIKVNEKGKA